VKSLVTTTKTYCVGSDLCYFDPGVKLVFKNGSQTIDALICYHCNDLCIVKDGKPVGYANFIPGRAKLVAFAKEILPTDKEIQSLSEKAE
jgi:hypothetical protein